MPPPWRTCSPQTGQRSRTSSSFTYSPSALAAERSAAGCSSFTRPQSSPLSSARPAEPREQLCPLLAVCPRCREVGGWLLELHQAEELPSIFGPIDAALARS